MLAQSHLRLGEQQNCLTNYATESCLLPISTGGSFGGSPLRREVGLGDAQAIDSVEITWPAIGRVQAVKDLALDHFYKIREGEATPAPWPLKKLKFLLVPDKVCGPPQWAR